MKFLSIEHFIVIINIVMQCFLLSSLLHPYIVSCIAIVMYAVFVIALFVKGINAKMDQFITNTTNRDHV